ncbi:MAG: hypothetical protein ACUZ8O_13690 [Candidatus Anammoxibacter sp.]
MEDYYEGTWLKPLSNLQVKKLLITRFFVLGFTHGNIDASNCCAHYYQPDYYKSIFYGSGLMPLFRQSLRKKCNPER